MPTATSRGFQIDFDLVAHELASSTVGRRRPLVPLGVPAGRRVLRRGDGAARRARRRHRHLDRCRSRSRAPSPSTDDDVHATYDPDQAHAFWRLLVQMDRVFDEFRSRFVGKSSPVHLFWGALDLAVTRFSGAAGPAAPRRRAELRSARDARGVLARGEQRRLLARRRRRGRLLLLRLPRARRLPGRPGRARGAALRRRARRVRAALRGGAHGAPTPTRVLLEFLAVHLRGRGRHRGAGTAPRSSAEPGTAT